MKSWGGLVSTLCYHLSIDLDQPGLIPRMGMGEIEVGVFPLVLVVQREINAMVPIVCMVKLSMRNGAVSEEEVEE